MTEITNRIVMVERFLKSLGVLRITTYIGDEKITDFNQLDKNNTESNYAFYEEIDGRCWIDLEKPASTSIKEFNDILWGNDPIKDWEFFNRVLWHKKPDGEEVVVWDQNNYDRLIGEYSNCCEVVNKGVKVIIDYSKGCVEEFNSGKKEKKNTLPIALILASWKAIKDRCPKCLNVEKVLNEQLDRLGKLNKI